MHSLQPALSLSTHQFEFASVHVPIDFRYGAVAVHDTILDIALVHAAVGEHDCASGVDVVAITKLANILGTLLQNRCKT